MSALILAGLNSNQANRNCVIFTLTHLRCHALFFFKLFISSSVTLEPFRRNIVELWNVSNMRVFYLSFLATLSKRNGKQYLIK